MHKWQLRTAPAQLGFGAARTAGSTAAAAAIDVIGCRLASGTVAVTGLGLYTERQQFDLLPGAHVFDLMLGYT
jgi:hypothetical protein